MKNILILLIAFGPSLSFSSDQVTIKGHTIDLHRYEKVPENESRYIEKTVNIFREFFRKVYKDGPTKRGVHPKTHGCYSAKMVIKGENIEKKDQVGIFQSGKIYDVDLRFSNGGPRSWNHDSTNDIRGIGIKVKGVEGDQLLPLTSELTQDFTLNSTSAFFSDSAKDYSKFTNIAFLETDNFEKAATKFLKYMAKKLEFRKAYRFYKSFKEIQDLKPTNPLGVNYFSITPFQHGEDRESEIVRYKVGPCMKFSKQYVNKNDPNFLRHNLEKYISQNHGCLSFQVQKMPVPNSLPKAWRDELGTKLVEHPSMAWNTSKNPFKEYAKIFIFKGQKSMDEKQCQRIVINPWNSLTDHKPVGGINRLRLAAYLFSIEMRKRAHHHK